MIKHIMVNCMDGYRQIPVLNYAVKHYGVSDTCFLTTPRVSCLLNQNRDSRPAQELLQDLLVLMLENRVETIVLVARDNQENETVQTQQSHLQGTVQFLAERYPGVDVVALWMDSRGEFHEVTRAKAQ